MKRQNNSNMPRALKSLGVSASLLLSACVSTSLPQISKIDGAHNGLVSSPRSLASSYSQNHLREELVTPGSIVIAKRLPPVTKLAELPLYGFLPFQLPLESSQISENWLEIDLSRGVVAVREGTRAVTSGQVHPEDRELLSGSLARAEVVAIESNPVWIAPDEYFTERNLDVPPEGDSRRFLKAALGDLAIFLDNGVVLHNGLPSLPHGKDSASRGAKTLPVRTENLERISAQLANGSRAIGSRVVIR